MEVGQEVVGLMVHEAVLIEILSMLKMMADFYRNCCGLHAEITDCQLCSWNLSSRSYNKTLHVTLVGLSRTWRWLVME